MVKQNMFYILAVKLWPILTFLKRSGERLRTFRSSSFFVSPYPTLIYWYGLVENFFNLKSQIGYPLNLIVYSKTCLKRPLKKKTLHNAGQKYCRMLPGSILQYFGPAFSANLPYRPLRIPLSGRFRQALLYSPTIGNKMKYINNLLR